jgi:glutamyl-tRNA synthetase
MHTNHVVRGEEWLPSAPIHVQLFNALGFELPHYAHLPVIMKNDNGNRRKLSKRLDPEASVSYFIEQGYPTDSLLIYLCTIANSNYEEFRLANPEASIADFKLSYNKFSLDGALFDLEKINNISKDVIFKTPIDTLVNNVKEWASKYDDKLLSLINEDEEMFKKIMNFGKDDPQPRKDYYKYAEIYEHINYMYTSEYNSLPTEELPYDQELINKVCNLFKEDLLSGVKPNKDDWFNHQKEIARNIGFAYNKKDMKANGFTYMFGEYMGIIRVALTKRKNAFDLVDIIETIGMEETIARLTNFIK